ncbi:MAG: FAD-dependent oxidoreductase, partial [Ramlibacter sp.]|nr:FAD-dependent oxidoreductase [Ramlibacter sp.]
DWVLFGSDGREIERASLVVVAAALNSNAIGACDLPLQPVRGQVSWNAMDSSNCAMPPFAMNGNGQFIAHVPISGEQAWFVGSTFDRDDTQFDVRPADHSANFERLQSLSPTNAARLEPEFAHNAVKAWTGIRCASSNRRPIVTEIHPGLWVSTAMGSRGLTYSKLCAELLAARLHAEPLPLQSRVAESLTPQASHDNGEAGSIP